jgi:hypothetical protein
VPLYIASLARPVVALLLRTEKVLCCQCRHSPEHRGDTGFRARLGSPEPIPCPFPLGYESHVPRPCAPRRQPVAPAPLPSRAVPLADDDEDPQDYIDKQSGDPWDYWKPDVGMKKLGL